MQLLNRLRALAERRRWMIGLAVGRGCRTLRAALVGAEGTGLSARVEVFAARASAIPAETASLYARFRQRRNRRVADAALLTAQLAEYQAALLDEFAAQVAPVWNRILAVAVDDPGLWSPAGDLRAYFGLCDAARLAELSGLNVIDAFPARDLAQDGRGRPLLPIPTWILLHDARKTRVLMELSRTIRMTYLPPSRDATGAARVLSVTIGNTHTQTMPSDGAQQVALAAAVDQMESCFPKMPRFDEFVLSGLPTACATARETLSGRFAGAAAIDLADLGIESGALKPSAVAILGLLHLDQVPANATAITGARIPRLLGRLTPGSLTAWHRLVRELAAAKPTVIALRSAV